jgi:hypothetical protein
VLELEAVARGRWVGLEPLAERGLRDGNGRFVTLDSAGFYELRPPGSEGGAAILTVAVNVDPAESDLRSADPQEVKGGLTRSAGAAAALAARGPDPETPRRDGWWLLLVAALALLAAESALSNRLSEAVR